ncbi:MAG: hypothetical protein ACKVT0_19125 [Planctomycetaceae bacterium]
MTRWNSFALIKQIGSILIVSISILAVNGSAVAQDKKAKSAGPNKRTSAVAWRTGKEFRQALASTITAKWRYAEFRPALQQISDSYRVAILLDRRIDPNQLITFEVTEGELGSFFEELAAAQSWKEGECGVSVVAHAVNFGPKSAMDRLRTLIELRTQELQKLEPQIDRKMATSLTSRSTRTWKDLQNPRELIAEWAKRPRVTIVNPERIEHDLWAAGALPQSTFVEACSIVLNQFDLTFNWQVQGKELQIELVDIPESPQIEKIICLKSLSAVEAEQLVKDRFPTVELTRLKQQQVKLNGRLEDIEEAAGLLNPPMVASSRTPPAKTKNKGPLSRRLFTLTIENASISSILEGLKAEGLEIEYDADAFRKAGVDLTQKISISVEKVSAEALFKILLDTLPVQVSIEGEVVRLEIAQSPK